MFRITIEEFVADAKEPIQRYQQTVDAINMRAVMNAVNSAPRKSRAKVQRTTSFAGSTNLSSRDS